ncbi:uncharacterized protein PHALS_00098 [Plasmopara halstedii]|uniref:RXLR phytopathogen effector protein WY-domain domain-containing protein n=1 Tax=Plasmopara halstedii TaxID=4781 RepID=A0A0P1A5D5_PLAHL|nr:uncharacterized protein PHALS_00098 [Plasmopara halstedii]CEG35764.1 hypothetical protein PHALS_00098 [Plasmopara halstedii]|eukprot:XP_024572133.1 hypothetical protein PHALS_00098 [Plasmopara halstedii]
MADEERLPEWARTIGYKIARYVMDPYQAFDRFGIVHSAQLTENKLLFRLWLNDYIKSRYHEHTLENIYAFLQQKLQGKDLVNLLEDLRREPAFKQFAIELQVYMFSSESTEDLVSHAWKQSHLSYREIFDFLPLNKKTGIERQVRGEEDFTRKALLAWLRYSQSEAPAINDLSDLFVFELFHFNMLYLARTVASDEELNGVFRLLQKDDRMAKFASEMATALRSEMTKEKRLAHPRPLRPQQFYQDSGEIIPNFFHWLRYTNSYYEMGKHAMTHIKFIDNEIFRFEIIMFLKRETFRINPVELFKSLIDRTQDMQNFAVDMYAAALRYAKNQEHLETNTSPTLYFQDLGLHQVETAFYPESLTFLQWLSFLGSYVSRDHQFSVPEMFALIFKDMTPPLIFGVYFESIKKFPGLTAISENLQSEVFKAWKSGEIVQPLVFMKFVQLMPENGVAVTSAKAYANFYANIPRQRVLLLDHEPR